MAFSPAPHIRPACAGWPHAAAPPSSLQDPQCPLQGHMPPVHTAPLTSRPFPAPHLLHVLFENV